VARPKIGPLVAHAISSLQALTSSF